ncbi:MAG: DUF4395 domain-containing protein [Actinomycetota bacterium]|jgi:sterol desaturase/sphingolipid hydroxylase (fatty acid hydroxylase superfamily)|nr:DUF4395 domain-containing protein [Actinomycetota bacterium]
MTEQALGDPRGPRTAAWLTSAVLAVALAAASPTLLALQALVFGLGTSGASPYDAVFRRLVHPRLGRPRTLEPEAPFRAAQLLGLVLTTVGALALLAGAPALGTAATAAALTAALLHAVTGLCLGCELYLLLRRGATPRTTS